MSVLLRALVRGAVRLAFWLAEHPDVVLSVATTIHQAKRAIAGDDQPAAAEDQK